MDHLVDFRAYRKDECADSIVEPYCFLRRVVDIGRVEDMYEWARSYGYSFTTRILKHEDCLLPIDYQWGRIN